MKQFNLPNRYAFKLGTIAELIGKDHSTVWNATRRMPGERLYLRAFKISPSEPRVLNIDLADFLCRAYAGNQVDATSFLMPDKLELTVAQVAWLLDCSEWAVRENIKRDRKDDYYLKGMQKSKTDFRVCFEDLRDFVLRNFIAEMKEVA